MAENKKICNFAVRWLDFFQSPEVSVQEPDTRFERKCAELGFQMDCGETFRIRYGEKAFYDSSALEAVLSDVKDEMLLGSAVYSKWRYITHWTQQKVTDPENRKWFSLALDRLQVISDKSWVKIWKSQAQAAPPALQKLMMGTMEDFLKKYPEDDMEND